MPDAYHLCPDLIEFAHGAAVAHPAVTPDLEDKKEIVEHKEFI